MFILAKQLINSIFIYIFMQEDVAMVKDVIQLKLIKTEGCSDDKGCHSTEVDRTSACLKRYLTSLWGDAGGIPRASKYLYTNFSIRVHKSVL